MAGEEIARPACADRKMIDEDVDTYASTSGFLRTVVSKSGYGQKLELASGNST